MCLERWQRRQPSLAQLQDMLITSKHLPRHWTRCPGSNAIPHRCRGAMPTGRCQDAQLCQQRCP